MHSMVPTYSLLDMNNVWWFVPAQQLTHCYVNLWLLFWTRQDQERFYVSSATMVIKTELCQYAEYRIWTRISRVHSPVVKAADCRSADPWFNSGRRTWFTFVTWYDKLTNHDFLMINIMSPITTSIRTITRKSVNMVAELSNDTGASWILDITDRLEGNPAVTKVLHAIALKIQSRFGADAVVDWMQWSGVPILAGGPAADRMPGRLIGESLDRLGNPTFRLGLQSQEQSQEQHIQRHDTVAFEDTTQDCLAIQAKAVSSRPTTRVCLRLWSVCEGEGRDLREDRRR